MLWSAAVLAVVAAFLPALFSGKTLFPPADGRPNYVPDHQRQVWESFSGQWSESVLGRPQGASPVYPARFLAVLLPPLVYHLLGYILDVVLLGLAGLYYLRGGAAVSGAMALALMGYSFTLVSAGHRGVFDMMPCGVFILGLLDRAMGRSSLLHYALIGACIAFGLSAQPDIMVMFLMLAAVYALYRFVRLQRAEELPAGRRALKIALGGLVCLVMFGVLSTATVRRIRDVVLPGRQAQIDSTTKAVGASGGEASEDKPKDKKAEWIFATNWSLPPEEVLEFVAPCVYGIETADRRGPYWGRLGRTLGWEEHKQGLMNLRQHTVYMGAIQLMFALLAVVWVSRRRTALSGMGDSDSAPRSDIFFWGGVFVVTLLLALGRYTPVYRLFYMLPYCSKIRAPVKFLHFSGLALSFLFAYGVTFFLESAAGTQGDEGKAARPPLGLGIAGGALALFFLIAAAGASGMESGLADHLKGLGLQSFAGVLTRRMAGALARAGVLFGIAAALLLLARRFAGRTWLARTAGAVFLLVVPMDLALVGREYVRVRDVEPFYHRNPILRWLEQDGPPLSRLSYHLSQRNGADWRYANLYCNGIRVLEPGAGHVPGEDTQQFLGAFSRNMPRLWTLTNTRYILGPTQGLESLIGHNAFEMVTYLSLAGGRYRDNGVQPAEAVLVRYKGALPRALFYHSWRVMPQTNMLPVLADEKWNPGAEVLVAGETAQAGGGGQGITPAKIEQYSRRHITIQGNLPSEGILLLNDQYDTKWRATVDGEPAELLRCNYVMRGVKVPVGQHTVEFVYQTEPLSLVLSLAGMLGLTAWAVVDGLKNRKERVADDE